MKLNGRPILLQQKQMIESSSMHFTGCDLGRDTSQAGKLSITLLPSGGTPSRTRTVVMQT
jgi:hypothetical protein